MPSIFTQIIKGEIPCYKIYEDDKTIAFLDIHPETKGHTLVVPKNEVDKLYELPDEDYVALMATAKRLSQNMEKVLVDKIYELPEEDYQALMATAKKLSKHMEEKLGQRTLWKVIGTDVPHAHIHLEPYDETWFYGREVEMTEADFKEIQEKLKID